MMITVAPVDHAIVRKNHLHFSDMARMGIQFAREDIARKQREKYFDEQFALMIPELKICLGQHKIPFVREQFDRVHELTKVTYTAFAKPLVGARPSVANYFLDHYKSLVLREDGNRLLPPG